MKKVAPCPGPGRLSLFRRCRPLLPPKNQRKLKSKGDKVVHIDNMLVRLKGGGQQRRSPRHSSFTSQFSSSNADFTSHGLNSSQLAPCEEAEGTFWPPGLSSSCTICGTAFTSGLSLFIYRTASTRFSCTTLCLRCSPQSSFAPP